MAITAETRQDIIELVVTAYNAAPGTTLLSELVAIIDDGGTLADVATELTTRTEWTSRYPTFQTAEEFADEWLGNLVPEASADALAEAKSVTVGLVNGGSSFADIMIAAQSFLSAASETDASFGTSAANWNNKVEVATHHTITQETAAQDDTVLADVTSDDDSVTTAKAAVDYVAPVAGVTKALTTGLDSGASFTGGTGDDIFTGTLTSLTTTTTATTGDSVVGGAGTDRLTISISDGATTPSNLIATSGVEELSIFNNDTGGFVLQGDLMDGLTDIFVTAGQDAITVDELNSAPNLHLISTNSNATITPKSLKLAGTSDEITILSNGTASTANVTATYNDASGAGVETVNLVGTGGNTGSATRTLTIASADLTTVNVTGDTNMWLVADLTGADNAGEVSTFNASAATGNIDITPTAGGSTEMSITMGSGDDRVTAGAMDKDFTIDGGAGTDTLEVSAAGYSAALAAAGTLVGQGVTNFETLLVSASGSADIRSFTNNTFDTIKTGGTATISGLGSSAATVIAGATGSITLDRATDGAADSASVTLAATTPGTYALLNVADEETVTLTSGGTLAGSNVITTLTATDATSLTISGNRDLTVTNAIGGTALATLDASGLAGQGVNLSISAANSLAAMTVTAGAGSEASANEVMNTITTGSGADTVTGGDFRDVITTGSGSDSVVAGGGNDTITTTFGNDYVDGGDGNDAITDSVGNDTLIGGAGNDTIDSAAGADSIDAGAGNDKIYVTTLGANDTIDGGTGTDTLSANSLASTIVAADFAEVTESSALNVTGVETAYIEVNTAATNTTTAPLNLDLTSSSLTTLNLDVNVLNAEAMKITNFSGSNIVMTGLSAAEDPEFVNVDGSEQTSITVTLRGFAPATAGQADMTFTGSSAVTVKGDSYLSTTAQTNDIGSITANSADTLTLSTDGTGGYAANSGALTVNGAVAAPNAQTLSISVGAADTMDLGVDNSSDVSTANSIAQTVTVSVGENGTLIVGGGDIDLASSAVNTLTVTNGIGGTIGTGGLDIAAGSIASLTGTLSASSTTTLDIDATITSGTVTMSTGSTWTAATLGTAATASSVTITGYGDLAQATPTVLAGSTFTYNAGGLTDATGHAIDASNLSGVGTITGTSGADTITGGSSNDVITGKNGADDITGGAGDDNIVLTEGTAAADNLIMTAASHGMDTITGFDWGGGAANDDMTLTVPTIDDVAGGAGNVSTAINAGGFTITALAANTAAAAGNDFVLVADGDATAVALTSTEAVIEAAIAVKMADTTDIAGNITATGEGFGFLFPNDANADGTVDSYFLGYYLAAGVAATTATADVNVIAIFKDADAANAAAADFI